MNETVEKLAQVIADACNDAACSVEEYCSPDMAKAAAIAALNAMREPTDAMVAAFLPYYHDNYRKGHEREDTSAVYVWQDMIDAAINEA